MGVEGYYIELGIRQSAVGMTGPTDTGHMSLCVRLILSSIAHIGAAHVAVTQKQTFATSVCISFLALV